MLIMSTVIPSLKTGLRAKKEVIIINNIQTHSLSFRSLFLFSLQYQSL